MKKYLYIITVFLLAACQGKGYVPAPPELVVEGWIEDGGSPYIYLTTSITPSPEAQQVSSLQDHVLQTARVTVSDGEQSVVLSGLASKRYFPPYVYTSSHITGQAGKTYTLTVEADGYFATAQATIPPSRQLDALEVIPFGDDPDQRLLRARFRDNPSTRDFYHCFVKIEKTDSTYVPVELSYIDDSLVENPVELTIRPGNSVARSERRQAFRRGERVRVKFRTMQEEMYWVWKFIGEQHAFSTIPFLVPDSNLPGNVDGALGYFAGYGCTNYAVDIP